MRSCVCYSFLVLVVLTQINLAYAEPFEVRGYRQGMSVAQLKRVAETNGHTLSPDQQIPGHFDVLQNDSRIAILSLSLCKDRLFSAQWLVSGGFNRFVKQLDELIKEGFVKTDVSWGSIIGYIGKEYFRMEVYFVRPGSKKEYYITATLFGDGEHEPTNYQITYSAVSGNCN